MSRIYFHTQRNGEAELPGYIVKRFGSIVSDLFVLSLSISPPFEKHPLFSYAPEWVTSKNLARLHFRNTGLYKEIAGYDVLDLEINTAISTGNDSVKLAAFIYGYSSVHGYFDPEDFGWLSQSIGAGIKAGFYGSNAEWGDLIALIQKATGPIVMSHSVYNRFPSPKEREWNDAFEEIKGQRILPNFTSVGHGLNGWQLIERLRGKQ